MSSKKRKVNLSNKIPNEDQFNDPIDDQLDDLSPCCTTSFLNASSFTNKIEHDLLKFDKHTDIFNTDHSKKLLKILNSQRENESLCDYEIKVYNESFHCHKCVLIVNIYFFTV